LLHLIVGPGNDLHHSYITDFWGITTLVTHFFLTAISAIKIRFIKLRYKYMDKRNLRHTVLYMSFTGNRLNWVVWLSRWNVPYARR